MIKEYNESLEALFRTLARENDIDFFHFVTYVPTDSGEGLSLPPYDLIPVPASYFEASTLDGLSQELCTDPAHVLGISSTVLVKRDGLFSYSVPRELVQVDYDNVWLGPPSPDLEQDSIPAIADDVCELCGQRVYVVRSSGYEWGQNLHFYGKRIVTHDEWKSLLERMKGESRIQRLWVESQLARDYSVLRVGVNDDRTWKNKRACRPRPVFQLV